MVQDTMDDTLPMQLKTKDFVADHDPRCGWYIAPVRLARAAAWLLASNVHKHEHEHEPMRVRMGHEDPAAMWLSHEPAQGLLRQFWSHERRRFEAADQDEAYALLMEIQRTFSNRVLN